MKKRATRASSSQHWEGGKFHFLQLRLNFLFTDIFFHLNCSWEVEIHILFFLPQHPYHIFLKDVKVLFIWRCTCLMMCKIYLFQGCVYFKSNHNLQSRLQEYKSRNLRIWWVKYVIFWGSYWLPWNYPNTSSWEIVQAEVVGVWLDVRNGQWIWPMARY